MQLLTDDVAVAPLLPVDGALPVGRPEVDARPRSTGSRRHADRVAHWEAPARPSEVASR